MTKEENKSLDELLNKQMMIVLSIPENAFNIKLEVQFSAPEIDNKIHKAVSVLSLKDIIKARKDYLLLDPDDDAFDTFVITEKGKEYLNELYREEGEEYEE